MSWLSNATGIHIGSGSKHIDPTPPAEIANDPTKLAQFNDMIGRVNGTIDNGNKMSHLAEVAAPVAIGGAAALGLGGFGSAGTAAGAAGSVGGAAGTASTAASPSLLDRLKGLISGGGSDGQGSLGALGDILGKVNGATGNGSILDKILLGGSIADAAATKKRQQDLQNKGIDYATDSYSARQPLRQLGLTQLQSQQTPDLSFLDNPKNPYTKTVTPFNISTKTPLLPKTGTY